MTTIPQDTSLPDDVVERAARAAYDDLRQTYEDDRGTGLAYADDEGGLQSAIVDGRVDLLRLVRVVSAALKAEG